MPRKPANGQTDQKTLSRRVLVLIERDMTCKTPRVVWQHELPILRSIFGEDEVKEIDAKLLDDGYKAKPTPDMLVHTQKQDQIPPPSACQGLGFVFTGDPASEYLRLEAAYGKRPDVATSHVEYVYGRFQSGKFEEMVGGAELCDMPDAQLRELVIQHGYLPMTGKDSTPDERREAAAKRSELMAMSSAELLKLAEQVVAEFA